MNMHPSRMYPQESWPWVRSAHPRRHPFSDARLGRTPAHPSARRGDEGGDSRVRSYRTRELRLPISPPSRISPRPAGETGIRLSTTADRRLSSLAAEEKHRRLARALQGPGAQVQLQLGAVCVLVSDRRRSDVLMQSRSTTPSFSL